MRSADGGRQVLARSGHALKIWAQGTHSTRGGPPRIASRTVASGCSPLLAVTAIGGNLRQSSALGHVHLGKALKLLGQILVRFNEIAQR